MMLSVLMMLRNNIRKFRLEKGLSQSELALLSGVSRNTISSLENYVYFPTVKNALLLCQVFGCTVEELFYFESEV